MKEEWVAKFEDPFLEVINEEFHEDSPLLRRVRINGDISCIRFDCRNRLWLFSREGHVEIVDMKRSASMNCVVRYIFFVFQAGITHSRFQLLVSGKMMKTNELRNTMVVKASNSVLKVFDCTNKPIPLLLHTLTTVCDSSTP